MTIYFWAGISQQTYCEKLVINSYILYLISFFFVFVSGKFCWSALIKQGIDNLECCTKWGSIFSVSEAECDKHKMRMLYVAVVMYVNLIPSEEEFSWQFVHSIIGPQYRAPTCIATPFHSHYEFSEEEEHWLTWKLRNTVSRLKKTAMAEKPNMRRGFLPIRSITKPWIQGEKNA